MQENTNHSTTPTSPTGEFKGLILAEKPSVARDIARIVGANKKEEGYLIGNGYAVTWAIGHLCTLAMPEDYGFAGYNADELPILPDPFKLTVRKIRNCKEYKDDPGAKKQLGVIKKLFAQCKSILVATDAGREGELIFRYIYEYLGCTKPFKRLWISSLTDKAIREGLENLKDGSEYDRLYQSGKARSQADWLVGINASRALSIAAGSGVYSLGRVQTPTLAMICKRHAENKAFVPQTYWQMRLELMKEGSHFHCFSVNTYTDFNEAGRESERIYQAGMATVKDISDKKVTEAAPLLYDLTELQKDANNKHGYSAQETLDIAQSLYEKKLITYPRTGSRYISEDVFAEIHTVAATLSSIEKFEGDSVLFNFPVNMRCVNTAKVADHHAILVTENVPGRLSEKERHIYDLIGYRILEAFMPECRKTVTTVTFDARGFDFTAKSTTFTHFGWRAIRKWDKKEETEIDFLTNLLPLSVGDEFEMSMIELMEKRTKPKPLFTESTLLLAMETAGKEVENEEARAAMKECGIGTPATRASIIETLLMRDYIVREKKTLVPTDKGQAVYEAVKDKRIADAMMTGTWESALAQIESGKMHPDTFHKSIRIYAGQITRELLEESHISNKATLFVCPICKNNSVRLYSKIAKCTERECDFKIFRTVCGRTLTNSEVTSVIEKGISPLLKGLKSKAGKFFEGKLKLNPDGTSSLQFANDKKKGGK